MYVFKKKIRKIKVYCNNRNELLFFSEPEERQDDHPHNAPVFVTMICQGKEK